MVTPKFVRPTTGRGTLYLTSQNVIWYLALALVASPSAGLLLLRPEIALTPRIPGSPAGKAKWTRVLFLHFTGVR
jgi:hypothetical protein